MEWPLGFATAHPSQTLCLWGYNFGSADFGLTIDVEWFTENPVSLTDVEWPMEDLLPSPVEWPTENPTLSTDLEWFSGVAAGSGDTVYNTGVSTGVHS